MAMIDLPFFPVATVEGFRALQVASASKEPDAMAKFAEAHPEIAAFGGWAKSAPWTGSYAEEVYNGLNSFIFTDGSGNDHAVRWSLTPAAQPVPIPPEELAKRGSNFLETEIVDRIKSGPARWTMHVTVANAGDPTVLPNGIRTSDDPFPAARSSAYRVSYDRRTAEENDYPRTATGAVQ